MRCISQKSFSLVRCIHFPKSSHPAISSNSSENPPLCFLDRDVSAAGWDVFILVGIGRDLTFFEILEFLLVDGSFNSLLFESTITFCSLPSRQFGSIVRDHLESVWRLPLERLLEIRRQLWFRDLKRVLLATVTPRRETVSIRGVTLIDVTTTTSSFASTRWFFYQNNLNGLWNTRTGLERV